VTAPDGLTLHVRRYGSRVASALPVVCLPGLAWTAADFHRLAAALAADPGKPRRVLALDYRGHGQSFLWTLADLSAVIIAKVRTIRRLKPVPSSSPKGRRCGTGSDRPPLKTTSLLAGTTLRRRKIGTRRHTRSLHGPLAARGTSKFSWCRRLLAGPAVRANNSDLRAVRHAELAHDLPNMKFDGTFTHRQPARNDLVRIATAQKFEDRSLPRC
jgi:pimeloyl-ACP methyl ester carboxylesterase